MRRQPAGPLPFQRALRLVLLPALFCSTALAFEPLGTPRPDTIKHPDGVPPNAAMVELGRALFFDHRLSGNRQQSCASCHMPELGLGDGTAKGRGTTGGALPRNTPHLYNLAWNISFFWDGRAQSLEEQALGPIQAPGEMNMPLPRMIATLSALTGYQAQFRTAFGSEEVSAEKVAQAIAAFERTLVSNNSAFDRYQAGDRNAMSPEAVRGLALFTGKAQCVQCHDGPNFTDNSFHNIGVGDADPGRATVVQDRSLTGAFKTPGLRNVALTAPYMHDGSQKTLEDVMRHYNRGGRKTPHLDRLMKPLKLNNREIMELIAFMGALTDPVRVDRPQSLPQ